MLENNITKDEEIKVYSQKLNILKWEKEFEECLNKAKSSLTALQTAMNEEL